MAINENIIATGFALRGRLEQIGKIIDDCEEIQKSQESSYTKEQAKITAYNEIKELFYGSNNEVL